DRNVPSMYEMVMVGAQQNAVVDAGLAAGCSATGGPFGDVMAFRVPAGHRAARPCAVTVAQLERLAHVRGERPLVPTEIDRLTIRVKDGPHKCAVAEQRFQLGRGHRRLIADRRGRSGRRYTAGALPIGPFGC